MPKAADVRVPMQRLHMTSENQDMVRDMLRDLHGDEESEYVFNTDLHTKEIKEIETSNRNIMKQVFCFFKDKIVAGILFLCPPEWNSGASSFCPVGLPICLSVYVSVCGVKTLTLAITFEP